MGGLEEGAFDAHREARCCLFGSGIIRGSGGEGRGDMDEAATESGERTQLHGDCFVSENEAVVDCVIVCWHEKRFELTSHKA